MLAARIESWGAAPVLAEIPEPTPGPEESLVRIEAAAVGHVDLTVASGLFTFRPQLPYIPGTEAAGRVLTSAVLATGTRVHVQGQGLGLNRDGCWSELVAVPNSALRPLPEALDAAVAATFSVPTTTAYAAVHDVGQLQTQERVAVTGASGAVGSLAVQYALRALAGQVIGVVGREEKRALVPAGATVVVGYSADALSAACDGGAVDLLVDTVGGEHLRSLLAAVRPNGRAALIGYTAGTQLILDLPTWLAADVRLLPVNLIRRRPTMSGALEEALALLLSGQLELRVERFPFGDIHGAVERLASGQVVGRVAVIP